MVFISRKDGNVKDKASEVFRSIANRMTCDLANEGQKWGLKREDILTRQNIRTIWEQTGVYRSYYKSGKHPYNESKIGSTIEKAIEYRKQKWNDLETEETPTPEKNTQQAGAAPNTFADACDEILCGADPFGTTAEEKKYAQEDGRAKYALKESESVEFVIDG